MMLRYSQALGYVFIPLGLLNLVLGGFLLIKGQFSVSIIIGLTTLFLGFAYLKKPYVTIKPDQFIIHTPLGWPQRIYNYNAPEDVKIAHNKILMKQDGEWKRLPVSKLLIQTEDWLTLRERFAEGGE
ncbi:hypothetical protein [Nostoc sp. TCL26-01]|uniref:hypothetical protein n=1 Tax=Nostoc sp. TCL26-01 TaxID=2576904 RepID=UPI0015BAAE30|nr:hypothetical protein [Nostoc sp. TCL26-01]QLE56825.1 hypothetical protein FD725_15690 [Nostoc sp. TCL26-01]